MPAANQKREEGESSAGESVIRGTQIGLPMVKTIGTIHSLSASRITWHSHEFHELLLLQRGATAYEFRGRRKVVELVGDQFMVVPPRAQHRGLKDMRMPSVLCGIVFDPRHPPVRNLPFTKHEMVWMARQFEDQPLAAQPMSAELRRMTQALSQALRRFSSASTEAVASVRLLVCGIILEAARQSTSAIQERSTDSVAAAIAHMEVNFAESLQMDDVVAHAGCSRARLFAVFKRETGMTPNDWLQRYRIKKACELLADTDRSITDIALSVGYSSSQYFNNVFRKYVGRTPSEHRMRKERRL